MEQLASFAVYMLTITSITFILAISLDLQVGHCGIVNFGQVVFLTVGAYATAIALAGGAGVLLGGAIAVACAASLLGVADVAVRAQHERDLLGHPLLSPWRRSSASSRSTSSGSPVARTASRFSSRFPT